MDSLVSVIIPTFGRNQYIIRAINSVLNQTYKNFEIIIVDDNNAESKDRAELEKIMNNLNDERIKYIKHKKNMNGAVARNTGIKNSLGEYITFLDDDDIFVENRLEKLVNKLKENNEYDAVYSNVFLECNNKLEKYEKVIPQESNHQLELLKLNSFIGTGSNMFFTKKSVEKVGDFDEKFNRHQDLEYLVRFLNKFKILGINEYLVIKDSSDKKNVLNVEKAM